ncbi:TIGR04211 family SH3 domain-containing protein [uncultured Alteromonas sp.]|jgi:SH3 domain protein|uniref:TIGR04211 family SH3 domain-containing protein n=1 Tax=uncultured Alteromonas sp. TaxID=179113 RepID=UPI0025EEFFC1|nr:TIGR04211 family SH3 domain-containing protein [uncultured Alteromonas sp.]
MRLLTFLFGLVVVSLPVAAQQSSDNVTANSDHYIADNLIVYLHSGPGRNYRILGSIEAGVPVTVLQSDADKGFTQISDTDEREGWVETQYLIDTISRRAQLPQLSQRLADSEQQLNRIQSRNSTLAQELAQVKQQNAQLEASLNESQQSVASLEAQISDQDTQERYRMFSYGGIVAGAGVLLGIIITFIPKRRRRNDSWM